MLHAASVTTTRYSHDPSKSQRSAAKTVPGKLKFIDFGCGTGASYSFATSLEQSGEEDAGLGIDCAADAVDTCIAKGISAERADVTTFDRKNAADATFAIDLLPELPGRYAFEAALINIIRAARNYTVIQHAYFDADGQLAAAGATLNGNDSKKIQYKPTIADYVSFLCRNGESLNIAGLGIFGLGKGEAVPVGLAGTQTEPDRIRDVRLYRSVRIVFGRREIKRFRAALEKAAAGQTLFMWERAAN